MRGPPNDPHAGPGRKAADAGTMAVPSQPRRSHLYCALAGALLLMLFSGLAITSSQQNSATVDEPLHLFAGYSYIRWGDFRANPEHPPLAKILAALPLAFAGIKDSPRSPSWDLIGEAPPTAPYTASAAAEMLFGQNDAAGLFFYSKLMMIGIAAVLGCFVFIWSKLLFGGAGAVGSLLMFALDPNMLAHAPIVHSDLPFAAFFFIGTYFLWRTLHELTLRNLVLAATLFALAVVTKYAYVSVLSAWALLGIYAVCASRSIASTIGKRQPIVTRPAKIALVTSVLAFAVINAYVALWAVYGFHYYAIPGGERPLLFDYVWPRSAFLQSVSGFLLQYHLVPEAWLYGQLWLLESLNRDSYLLGQMSVAKGSYLYFPIAFAVKTPIPTIALLTAAVIFVSRRGRLAPQSGAPDADARSFLPPRLRSHQFMWISIPVLIYFGFAVASGINIGVRHILPVYPFLFVLCGGVVAYLWRSRVKAQRAAVVFLGAWYVASALTVFPDYLAYFNEFAGGSRNGHKILLDSNLDWGQDLTKLRDWIKTAAVTDLQYAYFGFPSAAAPRYYGIDAQFLLGSWVHPYDISPPRGPRPPVLAISVNQLHGLYFEGGDKELASSLRELQPVARAGYSIWLYRMDVAIDEFQRRLRTNPVSARDHYHLGNLLNHQGRLEEAIARYREAVRIDPAFADARKKLALALAKVGALQAAIEQLQTILAERRNNEAEIRYYIGTILLYQRRYPEAVESLTAAVEAEPKSAHGHRQLARAFSAQDKLDEAIRHYRHALRLGSTSPDVHVALSRALTAQGRRDEAIRHYEMAIKILKATPGRSGEASAPRGGDTYNAERSVGEERSHPAHE